MGWYRTLPPGQRGKDGLAFALALYTAGRFQEAGEVLAAARPAAEGCSDPASMVECDGLALAIAARTTTPDRARALSEAFGAPDRRPRFAEGTEARWRAAAAAIIGDQDAAVTLLRQTVAHGMEFGTWLHRDPDFIGLRGYAPFEELLRPKN